jgi:hypothetical protein
VRRIAPWLVLCCVLTCGVATIPAAGSTPRAATLHQVKALVAASTHIEKLTPAQTSELPNASSEDADKVYKMYYGCISATQCVFGDTTSAATVVLFGDSHARMWLPALLPLATTDHFKIVVLGEDGCPVISVALTGSHSGCLGDTRSVVKTIVAMRPDAIIISDRTTWLKSVTSSEWQKGFVTTLKDLAPAKASIAVMGDIQIFNGPVISCLAINPTRVQRCSVSNPNPQQPSHATAEKSASEAEHVTYVNPTPWLCTSSKCSPIIGSYIAYWDAFHISVPYAAYLTGVVGTALAKTLRTATT